MTGALLFRTAFLSLVHMDDSFDSSSDELLGEPEPLRENLLFLLLKLGDLLEVAAARAAETPLT
jgi:hypothetical protein